MRKSLSAACLLALLLGILPGCNTKDKPEAANGVSVEAKSDGKQYRAVCVEKEQHGGSEYVLSKWMESREKADELGKYHGDFKYKGHAWRIDERVKPERAKP